MAFGSPQWMYASGGDYYEYKIPNSCRFNRSSSHHLTKTFGSGGNRKTWTFSAWVKVCRFDDYNSGAGLSGAGGVFGSYTNGGNTADLGIWGDQGRLSFYDYVSGYRTSLGSTTKHYRDTSAWYHVMIVMDSTQGTAANRAKIFVNGENIVGDLTTATYPSQNLDGKINDNYAHTIGKGNGAYHADSYMAEIHFVDGIALDASSFGEAGTYGDWVPKEYTGSHGTTGFYLDFSNSSNLGEDQSGNDNDWTVQNLNNSHDQMLDSPTNNFPSWNPLNLATSGTGTIALSEGNLKNSLHNDAGGKTTMLIPETGKWYWEVNMADVGLNTASGIADATGLGVGNGLMQSNGRFGYFRSGNAVGDGSYASFGDSFTNGDILGVAFDVDNEALYFAKNGTWQDSGDPTSGASKTGAAFTTTIGNYSNYVPYGQGAGGDSIFIANFGQDSSFAGTKTAQGNQDSNEIGDFYYTPPTGFLALCTSNLPKPAVKPQQHFNAITYTGNNGASAITGVGFQPDFVWFKARNLTEGHMLFDAVRGAPNTLFSNHTGAENTSYTNVLSAFNADGYTLGSNEGVNHSSGNYVAWNWKANGSGSSGSSGTGGLTPTVSANVNAGFSIVGWTGNMGLDTFTHGLSKAPEMMILKNRDNAGTNWCVWHKDLPTNKMMRMESDIAPVDGFAQFGDDTDIVVPTSTYFTVGNSNTTNATGKKIVNYLFHSVEGYSKVGGYTGNGNVDGSFVYTGFQPAFVMIKRTDGAEAWWMIDNKRETSNPREYGLQANDSAVELTSSKPFDMVSNGFKTRKVSGYFNDSGASYIYIAFAETPFKYSNAR